jgi:hypothetical protein
MSDFSILSTNARPFSNNEVSSDPESGQKKTLMPDGLFGLGHAQSTLYIWEAKAAEGWKSILFFPK